VRLVSACRVTELHRRLAAQNEQLGRLNERLFEESREDPLTRLGNRLRLDEDLEVLQARSRRYGHSYAIALCDVDSFKAYNDHYGHLAGDEGLKKVAWAITRHCGGGDTAYRYGGEEFLIVLPEQTPGGGHLHGRPPPQDGGGLVDSTRGQHPPEDSDDQRQRRSPLRRKPEERGRVARAGRRRALQGQGSRP
jgi:GGDEF domain-containing protein